MLNLNPRGIVRHQIIGRYLNNGKELKLIELQYDIRAAYTNVYPAVGSVLQMMLMILVIHNYAFLISSN